MDFPVTVESQEEFDDLVKERLGREQRKQDDLQAQVNTLVAEKSALEQATSGLDAAIEAAKTEGSDAAKAELLEGFRDRLRAAEVRAIAASLRFNDPSDALAAIGDLSDVPVGEDYSVDAAAITARLGEIAEKKPYLIAASNDFSFEQDGGLGARGRTDVFTGKTGVDLMASAFDVETSK